MSNSKSGFLISSSAVNATVILFLLLFIASCRTATVPNSRQTMPQPPSSQANAQAVTISPGMFLCVCVQEEQTLSGSFPVHPNGVINYPLLGKINVEGLFPSEVAEKIKTGLERDYLEIATVSVKTVPTDMPLRILGTRKLIRFDESGETYETILDTNSLPKLSLCPCDLR